MGAFLLPAIFLTGMIVVISGARSGWKLGSGAPIKSIKETK